MLEHGECLTFSAGLNLATLLTPSSTLPPGPSLVSNDCIQENNITALHSVDQAGSERTEAGESALPAEESPSAGTGRAQTLRNLQENIIDFIMGAGGETSLYLPCFLILAPHLSYHLAFPLLSVGAAGDEGDPV